MSSKALADMRYSEHVEGMLDVNSDYIRCGYDYSTQHPGWTRAIQAGDIFPFILAEYEKSETSYALETEWITLYTYPNNYSIKFKLVVDGNVDVRYYTYFSYYGMFDAEGNQIGNTDIPNATIGGSNNMFTTYKDTLYRDLVIYFIPSTHYPQGNPTAADAPSDFRLWFYLGNIDSGYSLSGNTLIYPQQVQGFRFEWQIGYIGSLESFSNYMKNHGTPYYEDMFTDEPLPEEPAGSEDTSHTGGGGGNYDNTSDPIDFPDVPTNGALVSGGIMAHRVARETLLSIMTDLWDTSLFDISTWQKAITDPVNAIVSLHALPVNPDVEADPNNLFIGNMDMHVKPPKVTSQYKVITFDPVEVKEYWGSALDYSPYTKVEIYLPFIKVQTLAPEDVIGNTITIRYHIDVLTGDCIAFIKCGNAVLYRFTGNCKMQIPLTVQSNTAATGIKQAAPQMAAGIATGGAIGLADAAATAAGNVVASKIVTQRSGEIAGSISVMDDFTPYLIIHRPKQSLAKDYNKFKGYPSNITRTLSSLKGYTEVEHINLGVDGATDAELEEIKTLLQAGVII